MTVYEKIDRALKQHEKHKYYERKIQDAQVRAQTDG